MYRADQAVDKVKETVLWMLDKSDRQMHIVVQALLPRGGKTASGQISHEQPSMCACLLHCHTHATGQSVQPTYAYCIE